MHDGNHMHQVDNRSTGVVVGQHGRFVQVLQNPEGNAYFVRLNRTDALGVTNGEHKSVESWMSEQTAWQLWLALTLHLFGGHHLTPDQHIHAKGFAESTFDEEFGALLKHMHLQDIEHSTIKEIVGNFLPHFD